MKCSKKKSKNKNDGNDVNRATNHDTPGKTVKSKKKKSFADVETGKTIAKTIAKTVKGKKKKKIAKRIHDLQKDEAMQKKNELNPDAGTTESSRTEEKNAWESYNPTHYQWQGSSSQNSDPISNRSDNGRNRMDFDDQHLDGDPSYSSFDDNRFGVLPFEWQHQRGRMRRCWNNDWKDRNWSERSNFKIDRRPQHYHRYNDQSPHRNYNNPKNQRYDSGTKYGEQNFSKYDNQMYDHSQNKKGSKKFQDFQFNFRGDNKHSYQHQFNKGKSTFNPQQNDSSDWDDQNYAGPQRFHTKTFDEKSKSSTSLLESKKDDDPGQVRKDQLKLSLKASEIIDNILKGGSGKVTKSTSSEVKEREKCVSPLQSRKVCSSLKDFSHSKSSTATSKSETGTFLLERAERLCKELREKRELSKSKTDASSNLMMEPPPLQRSNVSSWLSSVDSLNTDLTSDSSVNVSRRRDFNNKQFNSEKIQRSLGVATNFKESSKLVSSTSEIDKILPRHCSKNSDEVTSASSINPDKTQSNQSSNISLQDNLDLPLKVHSHKNTLPAKFSPRVRSLSESSDKSKRSNKLDKDSISKLVNSPRSRKDRMQVLKFLKVYTKQQQKHRPKLSLVPANQDEQDADGQFMNFDELPEDIQNQVKELIETESGQDLNSIINLVDDESDDQLEKQCSVVSDNVEGDSSLHSNLHAAAPSLYTFKTDNKLVPDNPMTLDDLVTASTVDQSKDNLHGTKKREGGRIQKSVDAYMSSSHMQSLTASVMDIHGDSDLNCNDGNTGSVNNVSENLLPSPTITDNARNMEADETQTESQDPQTRLIEIIPDPTYQCSDLRKPPSSVKLEAVVGRVETGSLNHDLAVSTECGNKSSDNSFVQNGPILITPSQNDTTNVWPFTNEQQNVNNADPTNESELRLGENFEENMDLINRNYYSDDQYSSARNENDSSTNDYMTQIYELSLKEDKVRERKGEVELQIQELQNLLDRTREQLKDKEHLRSQYLNEEEILRSKRMRLLKGAVEGRGSNSKSNSMSRSINSSSSVSERIHNSPRFGQNDCLYPEQTPRFGHSNSSYRDPTTTNDSHFQIPMQISSSNHASASQVSVVPLTNEDEETNDTLANSKVVNIAPQIEKSGEPDSTNTHVKPVNSNILAVPDSTCTWDENKDNHNTEVTDNNNECKSQSSEKTDSDLMSPESGATVKYMGSFSLPDIDSTVLQSLVSNYSEVNNYNDLQHRPYVLLDEANMLNKETDPNEETDPNFEFEADEEEPEEQVTVNKATKSKTKCKKRKNNKNRSVLVSSNSSSSECSSSGKAAQSNLNSPTKKVRKKLNASPTAKLVKEYLHAESSTDVEINGLEPKSKISLGKKIKKKQ